MGMAAVNGTELIWAPDKIFTVMVENKNNGSEQRGQRDTNVPGKRDKLFLFSNNLDNF